MEWLEGWGERETAPPGIRTWATVLFTEAKESQRASVSMEKIMGSIWDKNLEGPPTGYFLVADRVVWMEN